MFLTIFAVLKLKIMDYIQSDVKHYLVKSIRALALLDAIVGIGFIIGAFAAGSHGMPELFAPGICCIVSSIFPYSFSYIVEAACLYIEKRHKEIDSSTEESE